MAFGYESVELSLVLGFKVLKTCNCRHFQCSEGIEWCESVELSSFFCFLNPEIRALERVGAGCFFLSSMVFGYESVELSLVFVF